MKVSAARKASRLIDVRGEDFRWPERYHEHLSRRQRGLLSGDRPHAEGSNEALSSTAWEDEVDYLMVRELKKEGFPGSEHWNLDNEDRLPDLGMLIQACGKRFKTLQRDRRDRW